MSTCQPPFPLKAASEDMYMNIYVYMYMYMYCISKYIAYTVYTSGEEAFVVTGEG